MHEVRTRPLTRSARGTIAARPWRVATDLTDEHRPGAPHRRPRPGSVVCGAWPGSHGETPHRSRLENPAPGQEIGDFPRCHGAVRGVGSIRIRSWPADRGLAQPVLVREPTGHSSRTAPDRLRLAPARGAHRSLGGSSWILTALTASPAPWSPRGRGAPSAGPSPVWGSARSSPPLLGAETDPVRGKGRHHKKKKHKSQPPPPPRVQCDPDLEVFCGVPSPQGSCCLQGGIYNEVCTSCGCCPPSMSQQCCVGGGGSKKSCCEVDGDCCDGECCHPGTKCCYANGVYRCIGKDECCPGKEPSCPSNGLTASTLCGDLCCPEGTECRTNFTGQQVCCVPGRLMCGESCCSADAGECCQTPTGEYYCCTQGSHCCSTGGNQCCV
jgi:hypothetical protein